MTQKFQELVQWYYQSYLYFVTWKASHNILLVILLIKIRSWLITSYIKHSLIVTFCIYYLPIFKCFLFFECVHPHTFRLIYIYIYIHIYIYIYIIYIIYISSWKSYSILELTQKHKNKNTTASYLHWSKDC